MQPIPRDLQISITPPYRSIESRLCQTLAQSRPNTIISLSLFPPSLAILVLLDEVRVDDELAVAADAQRDAVVDAGGPEAHLQARLALAAARGRGAAAAVPEGVAVEVDGVGGAVDAEGRVGDLVEFLCGNG